MFARHLARATPKGRQIRVPELIAHTRCFWPGEKEGRRNGSVTSEELARRYFAVNLSRKPVWIIGDLVFPGEISRKFAFGHTDPGKRRISLPDGRVEPDRMAEDPALAYRSGETLVIITGCPHAGIWTITEYPKKNLRQS